MAPMRADYNCVALLSCCGETDLLDTDVQRVAEENFLVLPIQQCTTGRIQACIASQTHS